MKRPTSALGIIAPALGACLFVVACGDQKTNTERVQVGDTLMVRNAAPRHRDTIRAREVVRIGEAAGPPEVLFSDIYSFTVSPGGTVFVHDRGEGIRAYDQEGAFLERTAGVGQGPGEVEYLRALAASGDSTLVAYGLRNNRITVWRGSEVLTYPRPEGMPRYGGDGVLIQDDGSIWVALNPPFPGTRGIPHPRPTFARLSESGELVDTVFTPASIGEKCPELSSRAHRAGFWEDGREPYLAKAKWTLGSDGSLMVGCPTDYTFDVHRPNGSVLRINRPWEPMPLDDEMRDFLARQAGIGGLPSEWPAYARLLRANDGRYWVRPTIPSRRVALAEDVAEQFGVTHTWEISSQATFDVFDPDGLWLGTVALPADARYSGYPTEPPVVIRGDTVWAVAQDSLDVQYVVKYAVEWPGTE